MLSNPMVTPDLLLGERLDQIEQLFKESLTSPNQSDLTRDEFKKIMPHKNVRI